MPLNAEQIRKLKDAEIERYWDLDDQKRLELTTEQVADYCQIEQMGAGISIPPKPDFTPLPFVEVEKQVVFVVETPGGFSSDRVATFGTKEHAESFMTLEPIRIDTDSKIGYDHKFARRYSTLRIREEHVYRQTSIVEKRKDLAAAKAIEDLAKERREDRDTALRKARDLDNEIWENWHELHQRKRELDVIRAAFGKLIERCKGDREIAFSFLCDAHDRDLCEAAIDSGDRLNPPMPLAEPVPAAEPAPQDAYPAPDGSDDDDVPFDADKVGI